MGYKKIHINICDKTKQLLLLMFTDVPGTLTMTVDDDVVPCGSNVIANNSSPTIGCTISDASDPTYVKIRNEGRHVSHSSREILNNDTCLYNITTHGETDITDGNKHNITCSDFWNRAEVCSITLEKGKVSVSHAL